LGEEVVKGFSRSRDHALSASGESLEPFPVAVTAGEIYWRGVHKSRAEATRLRDEFARKLPAGDWFAPLSKIYADELTRALRMTEREHA
jgi:hypothetical protein